MSEVISKFFHELKSKWNQVHCHINYQWPVPCIFRLLSLRMQDF
jgi:hypothetical protein